MKAEQIKLRIADYKHNKSVIYKLASERQLWMFAVADIEGSLTDLERLLLKEIESNV